MPHGVCSYTGVSFTPQLPSLTDTYSLSSIMGGGFGRSHSGDPLSQLQCLVAVAKPLFLLFLTGIRGLFRSSVAAWECLTLL